MCGAARIEWRREAIWERGSLFVLRNEGLPLCGAKFARLGAVWSAGARSRFLFGEACLAGNDSANSDTVKAAARRRTP
jgi:hypothetical protein